ncbi:hypothetical protein EV286_107339 [Rhizobium sp. BK251]|nr:hypothetical protein EV286_107339 [Rhizobium sp. BK251]
MAKKPTPKPTTVNYDLSKGYGTISDPGNSPRAVSPTNEAAPGKGS